MLPKTPSATESEGLVDERPSASTLLRKPRPIAVGAGAVGGVEREVARLEVVHRVAVLGAGERERSSSRSSPGMRSGSSRSGMTPEAHATLRELGRLLHGLGNAPEARLAYHDAVDDDLDVVA